MPTYDYKCEDCKKSFSVVLTLEEHESVKITCPKCASPHVRQKVSRFFAITGRKA